MILTLKNKTAARCQSLRVRNSRSILPLNFGSYGRPWTCVIPIKLQTALNRLKEIPNQLKAANDSYRQNLSLYRNGLSDIITLDAALNILFRAETDYMQAKYDYSSALFQKAITENQVNSVLNLLK